MNKLHAELISKHHLRNHVLIAHASERFRRQHPNEFAAKPWTSESRAWTRPHSVLNTLYSSATSALNGSYAERAQGYTIGGAQGRVHTRTSTWRWRKSPNGAYLDFREIPVTLPLTTGGDDSSKADTVFTPRPLTIRVPTVEFAGGKKWTSERQRLTSGISGNGSDSVPTCVIRVGRTFWVMGIYY